MRDEMYTVHSFVKNPAKIKGVHFHFVKELWRQ